MKQIINGFTEKKRRNATQKYFQSMLMTPYNHLCAGKITKNRVGMDHFAKRFLTILLGEGRFTAQQSYIKSTQIQVVAT
jgi:hypothetical protein